MVFGQSIPLEPLPVLDTTDYLGKGAVNGSDLGNKTGQIQYNTPLPHLARTDLVWL